MLTDAPKVIRWRLREVMARKRITGRDLASALDLHETSISRLRASDTMPRLDGEQLNALCQALDCTPGDLLEYIPDDAGQGG
ncbi:helix-turn-helix domain-containing protein [Gloeobacter kilaueensis]|uniref:XRE family transcriptional regulator n=1 Tax=Gloeobacter kilaueensis (strain ATCC BAA-2537 / CCAP 1431/1 / ULC 316 / JS1) TaxID=1183438 RepID=U5QDQ1_GLOK1|nr:helix-turn-helix transcriptional regulator [Gloeobacter kilaueensis]AGY57036.1 XRE family transcriptional regulator [Gloeobacter kilaueensis JS1]